ncbi:hypothetical protein HN51_031009 [Arachis hypogaea]
MAAPEKCFLVTDLSMSHHHLIANLTYHSIAGCKIRSSGENVGFEIVTLNGHICSLASTTISTYHPPFFFFR